jgi:multicomponent Na+:H+ antiporter subunit C
MIFLAPLFLFCVGLFIMISSVNNFRRLVGLSILQNSVIIFFVMLGKVDGGIPPILENVYLDENVIDAERTMVREQIRDPKFDTANLEVNNINTADTSKVARKTSGEDAERTMVREQIRDPKFDTANLEVSKVVYSSGVPHVLMLTAIVVGFATFSVGLSLCGFIKNRPTNLF